MESLVALLFLVGLPSWLYWYHRKATRLEMEERGEIPVRSAPIIIPRSAFSPGRKLSKSERAEWLALEASLLAMPRQLPDDEEPHYVGV